MQNIKRKILFSMVTLMLLMSNLFIHAQEMPPRPIGISLLQNLSFGAFYQGQSGGTVTIDPSGMRTATGDIILVNYGFSFFPAIFLLEGNPGAIVHIMAGPDTQLNGSNGGSMTLMVGEFFPGDPIIINVAPPGQMQIHAGGTLLVGSPAANPPGNYSGFFTVIFIQE
jgi:hypothetical protein